MENTHTHSISDSAERSKKEREKAIGFGIGVMLYNHLRQPPSPGMPRALRNAWCIGGSY